LRRREHGTAAGGCQAGRRSGARRDSINLSP
jgi:hypothetical protein